jgi:hypothetical protein
VTSRKGHLTRLALQKDAFFEPGVIEWPDHACYGCC